MQKRPLKLQKWTEGLKDGEYEGKIVSKFHKDALMFYGEKINIKKVITNINLT